MYPFNLKSDIAVIGMACRFPQANNPQEYLNNILDGRICFETFPQETSKDLSSFEKGSDGKYIPVSAILEDIEYFDAEFFNISPQEAAITDPQQRILLECAWEALEDSGYIAKRQKYEIGVYASSGKNFYLLSNIMKNDEVMKNSGFYQIMIGNSNDFIGNKISYKLGLTGPSLSLQTACSSSLIALNYGCQDLFLHNCDLALIGVSSIRSPQKVGYMYEESGILSPDGKCLPFDDKANGTVIGNGTGAIILKRLSDAMEDNDFIYGVIKGIHVNNDGNNKIGYTAPSINGQKNVISKCLKKSGIKPEQIGLLEAHGTGTKIGDPVEMEALKQAFNTKDKNYCAISSVKWQIGHLDSASGIAGVIKAILCLKEKVLPPSPYFQSPNKLLSLENSPFYMIKEKREWKTKNTPRYAGVSSFGLGGTNSHVILAEAPLKSNNESKKEKSVVILPFSAKNIKSLEKLINKYIYFFETNPDLSLDQVSYTLWEGRHHFKEARMAIVCKSVSEAIQKLKSNISQISKPRVKKEKICIDFSRFDLINDEFLMNIPAFDYNNYEKIKQNRELAQKIKEDALPFIFSLIEYLEYLGIDVQVLNKMSLINRISDTTTISYIEQKLKNFESIQIENLLPDTLLITSNQEFMEDSKINSVTIQNFIDRNLHEFICNIWNTSVDFKNFPLSKKHSGFIPLPTYQFNRKKIWIDAIDDKSGVIKEDKEKKDYSDPLKTTLFLWEQILGVPNLKPENDFFDIGGDSLSAVRYLSKIGAIYSVKIEMDDFIQLLSASEVASFIKQKMKNNKVHSHEIKLFREKSLHLLKSGDNTTPLIIFHPAGGTTFCYNELLRNTKITSAIYGFQFPIQLLSSSVKKIPELAREYYEIIKQEIPNKEYSLMGYSLGGNLALELAVIMQMDNIKIKELCLIDSHAPEAYKEDIIDEDSVKKCFPFILESFLKIDVKEEQKTLDIRELYSQLKEKNDILSEISEDQFMLLYKVWKYNHLSLRNYEHLQNYKGDVILYKAVEKESEEILDMMNMKVVEKEEWEKYIDGKLEIISVLGNHYTMLSSPHVKSLAKEINRFKL